MFRKKGRRERKLAHRETRRAPATVLHAARFLPGQAVSRGVTVGGTYRVQVRVEPEGEPAFDATLDMRVTDVAYEPHEGRPIPVMYAIGDHGSVTWDKEEARAALERAENQQEIEPDSALQ
jgi:hypothetical protein